MSVMPRLRHVTAMKIINHRLLLSELAVRTGMSDETVILCGFVQPHGPANFQVGT
jgi:hypothetical protein